MRSRSGETITATRPAPASRAASTGQATIGRPQTGCRTLGSEERMRVPSPAAMIRTVGPPPAEEAPLTRGIVAVAGSSPPPDGFGTIPCGWGHAAALIGEGNRATVRMADRPKRARALPFVHVLDAPMVKLRVRARD